MPEVTVQNVEDIVMEPCDVIFGTQNLGFTIEATKVSLKSEYKDIKVQQKVTAVSKRLISRVCQVTVAVAEYNLALFATIIPGSTLITDASDATKKRLEISDETIDLYDFQDKLTLQPQSGKTDRIFTGYHAVPTGDMEYAFDSENVSYYNVVFDCLGGEDGFIALGDPTAIPAPAGG